jgi:uncharacterized membrane protein YedE/YeeE
MATVSQTHDLKKELGIDADHCPTFRTRFSFDEQKALINEDLFAAKSVMAVLFAIVTGGLIFGVGTVLVLTMLR